MKQTLVNYILLGGVTVLIFLQFFDAPEGISPEEELYRLKIHDLNQAQAEKDSIINDLELKNTTYENAFDSIKNSATIDTATVNQLNGYFADYLKNR